MLGLRRTLAVALVPLTVLLFFIALIGGRVDSTLLDADFLERHARAAGIAAAIHQEALPEIVDEYIQQQDERLPDNLSGADLPTDAEARMRFAAVLQTLIPEPLLDHLVTQILRGIVPYLVGRTDTFEVNVSLHDPLVATFGHAPREPSVFEDAWVDLDVSQRLIAGFAARAEDAAEDHARTIAAGLEGRPIEGDPTVEEADGVGDGDEPGLLQALVQDAAAPAWWDEQMFDLIDGALPFLVGDSDEFALHIDFSEHPALAPAFAPALRDDPETLAAHGWRFTDEDLREQLAQAEDVTLADIDNALAIFRPEGTTFDQDDLIARMEAGRQSTIDAGEEPPMDIEGMRRILSRARLVATWGAGAAAALLIALAGVLGGRTWSLRFAWSASMLAVASVSALLVTGPAYALALAPRIDAWLEEGRTATGGPFPDTVRLRVVDQGAQVIEDFVGGLQWRALAWLVVALAALALSAALQRPAVREAIRGLVRRRPAATA